MTHFRNPERAEISHVMENLRDKSREELELQAIDPMDLVLPLLKCPFTWVVYAGSDPAALIGALPLHPGVKSLFGFGTDNWKSVWKVVTLVARRDMFTAVRDAGVHRAHALSPAHHKDTHRWLKHLGATHEAEMPGWGVGGEDFKMFSWLKE